ncbi:MAG: ABC transporter permease [Cyclobacteriaceae bacterium]
MLRHTLLLIFRNFKRFKTTFFINLIGLSSGLACAMFIYLWVADELSMDKFHEKDSQLFQVMTNQNRSDEINTIAQGPGLLPEALAAEFPEVEHAVGSSGAGDMFILSVPGKNVNGEGQFAGKDFFNIFSYPLLHGNKDYVLAEKNSIVLSEEMARALFNTTEDVIGKMVEWQARFIRQQVIVTGVFKNVTRHSSVQFDFVTSFEAYKELLGSDLHWGNHNATTYLQLKETTKLSDFNAKIEDFIRKRDKTSILAIFAKPYSDNYLYGKHENGKVVGGRITYVKLFSAIAIFIVVIACINFMNLATAKASRRIKEVGIKKAMGAPRKTLIAQYIGESLLMSFASMALAVLIVDILLPQFNVITDKHLFLPLNGNLILVIAAITLFTGLLSGSYPALYLSRFNPAFVLKGKFNVPSGEQWARKGLVIFQFALSIIFIVSVWVIYRQMEYVQTKHLGYSKENIIYFKSEGTVESNLTTFLDELKNIPGVVQASSMWGSVAGQTSFTIGSFDWKGMDPDEIVQFGHLGINYDMIELLDIEMATGRSFSRDFPSDTTAIILNESAIKMMGLKDPVGEKFGLWGNEYKIIGVTKDFHFKSLHEDVTPFFFRLIPNEFSKVMVKIAAGEEKETIANIQKFYKKFNPGYVFDFSFLDAEYQAQYAAEQRVAVLSKYFAGLAILISCLGLFGLAAFTAERRLKEIGIRKVMGSSVLSIVYLLSSDFNKIVLAAIVIALPISYLGTQYWLNNFAYKIALEWWYFAGAGTIALVIAWLTVGMQAVKAARMNPVKCLRDD